MSIQSAALHTDTNGVDTSAEFGDPGDGTNEWYLWVRIANGGDAALGLKADAAVTNPASSASAIALLKGLLTTIAAGQHVEDAAHVSGDTGTLMLAVRNDLVAALTSTNGDNSAIAVTAAGEVIAVPSSSNGCSATAPTNATTTAYATNLVVKATPGVLFGISGYNSNASAQFIQIHDATSLPSNGAAPKVLISVPATSPFSIDFGQFGRFFGTGIVVCNSSTGPTKTIGSADIWVDAQYR